MFASLASAAASAGYGSDALSTVLLALAVAVVSGKVASALVGRLGLPAVLGELFVGILAGNAALLGGPDLSALASNGALSVVAELGAVLLLFQVGLESTTREMLLLGARAALVAVVGVTATLLLGFGAGALLHPGDTWLRHAFLGAMLGATSVGITARVLGDAQALRTRVARLILGAAVIDDVLGLLALALVSGISRAASASASVPWTLTLGILGKALAFLAGALVVGSVASPRVFRGALAFRSRGLVLSLSLGLCFLLSYLAGMAGLAPIIGAFAAGLLLEDVHFEGHFEEGEPALRASLEPLTSLLVPVFFIRMGMLVDLRSLASSSTLALAVLLSVAAILGKLGCCLVAPKGVSRLALGLGMMPRGEVSLIFAGAGAQIVLAGRPMVDGATYAAIVLVVVVTTLLPPPLLYWRLRRGSEVDVQEG